MPRGKVTPSKMVHAAKKGKATQEEATKKKSSGKTTTKNGKAAKAKGSKAPGAGNVTSGSTATSNAPNKLLETPPRSNQNGQSGKNNKKKANKAQAEDDGGGGWGSTKVHLTHDEKRHMKYIRNKIRDEIDLTEEETAYATAHNIVLAKKPTVKASNGCRIADKH